MQRHWFRYGCILDHAISYRKLLSRIEHFRRILPALGLGQVRGLANLASGLAQMESAALNRRKDGRNNWNRRSEETGIATTRRFEPSRPANRKPQSCEKGPFWQRVPWCCVGAVELLGYCLQPSLFGQGGGLVGCLPGELGLDAAKVAIRRGLLVDGPRKKRSPGTAVQLRESETGDGRGEGKEE